MSARKKAAEKDDTAEVAALNLEPWDRKVMTDMPSNDAWLDFIVIIRAAAAGMCVEKAFMVGKWKEDPTVYEELLEQFNDKRKALKAAIKLIDMAEGRLIVAGTAAFS
jgi:hypothetical protein